MIIVCFRFFQQPYNPYTNPYLAAYLDHGHHHARKLPSSVAHHEGVHHHGHKYYEYDVAQIPECAYTNKHYYNLTFCLQDDYYPV